MTDLTISNLKDAHENVINLFALVKPLMFLGMVGLPEIGEQIIMDAQGEGINPRWLELVKEVRRDKK